MQVYYGELDEDATHKIMMTATCPARAVPLPEEAQTNGSDKILLLGNSFINSSDIGNFLDKMLDSQESFFSAEPKAYAMASVSRFTSDNQIMFEIARGNYAYVFLCGFYSDGDIEVLHLLKERCEYSNTKLVIFPAHNENRTIIDKAVLENQDLYFLDWKGEIDALIQSGIDPSLLYVNDTHKHSTKLAGYVGAMMIYKALYGTALSDIDIDLEGNQNFNEILKSYIESNGTIDGYTAQIYNIQ